MQHSSCTCHLFPILSWARATIENTEPGTLTLWCCCYQLTEPKAHAKNLGSGGVCEDYTLCWTESMSWKPLTEKPAFGSWKAQFDRLSHFGI